MFARPVLVSHEKEITRSPVPMTSMVAVLKINKYELLMITRKESTVELELVLRLTDTAAHNYQDHSFASSMPRSYICPFSKLTKSV
jgi:hypothetical protein